MPVSAGDFEVPVTRQPPRKSSHPLRTMDESKDVVGCQAQHNFGFKSPRDDCQAEDCCCCCLFVYLLFGKDIKTGSPARDPSSSYTLDKKLKSSYCYYNNIASSDGMDSKSGWFEKFCLNKEDNDGDGWPTAEPGATTCSSNTDSCNHSPINGQSAGRDDHHGGEESGDMGGDCGGDGGGD